MTTEELHKEILRLTDFWYRYVGMDHHKDRDCHWTIEETWSYGAKPKYVVRHDGYIFEGGERKCDTYENALRELRDMLKEAIKEERKTATNILYASDEYDEIQVKQAQFVLSESL